MLASGDGVMGLKSLREALKAPTHESLRESFNLSPLTIRRLKSDGKKQEKLRDYKKVNLHRLSMQRHTGSWSYDWRLAFFELKQHYKDDESSISEADLIRQCLHRPISRYYQVRAQDIPRPSVWTTFTFLGYVQDLANSEVTRLMHRHIYKNNTTHEVAVHDMIMSIFADESLEPFMTPQAFHIAFRFFFRHNSTSSVRVLFGLMNSLQIPISTTTFNIMLRGAASRKDLHNFTFLLRVMVGRGLSPNVDTWVSFLAVLNLKIAKLLTVRYIKELGLLQRPAVLKAVVNQIIDIKITNHISSEQDLVAFTTLMDAWYGIDWLSVSAGNHICHILGENGLVSQAVEVLGLMADRGCKPNNVTLHIFLGHCRRLRQPGRAIEVLRLFQSQYGLFPKQDEFDSLFMLAWRNKRVNLCRVIWRVACLQAAVSYRMQELVLRSLLRNTPKEPRTITDLFMKSAGKIIVGIDIGASQLAEKLIEKLSCWAEPGEQRKKSTQLAKSVLARDLDATRHYTLVGDFTELLTQALALDASWDTKEAINTSTLWKIQHAVPMEIKVHPTPNTVRTERWRVGRGRGRVQRERGLIRGLAIRVPPRRNGFLVRKHSVKKPRVLPLRKGIVEKLPD
ncbi:hypothetical protein MMC13_000053 [Lambiella insularis]|nr:hypothetical protein [Lambiella insularis]